MSDDDKEFKRAEQRKKRGSRHWLAKKLNTIEAASGIGARDVAADKWAGLVWHNPHEAGFAGADAVERIQKLASAATSLKDEAAKQKIQSILFSGDDAKISRIADILDNEKIKKAVLCQGRDEERIRMLADVEARIKKDPTGHLKARRRLRMETKQAVATINMTLGLVGSDGYHHATPFELDLRNQQKARHRKFGESTMLSRGEETVSMLTVMEGAGKKKLAEIITLAKGLEKYAKAAGLDWAFVTLTAPPRMHCNPKNGHSTWDGTTPDQAHEWIHNEYRNAESRLRTTHNIVISGLRIPRGIRAGRAHKFKGKNRFGRFPKSKTNGTVFFVVVMPLSCIVFPESSKNTPPPGGERKAKT